MDKEQKSLAHYLSSAGLSSSRVATELLYMLPRPFVVAYARLFDRALKEDTAHSVITETSKGIGSRAFEGHWVVRDENAMGQKRKMDKRLRDMAREIIAESKKKRDPLDNCPRCGRFQSEDDWSFCPWCGAVREERQDLRKEKAVKRKEQK